MHKKRGCVSSALVLKYKSLLRIHLRSFKNNYLWRVSIFFKSAEGVQQIYVRANRNLPISQAKGQGIGKSSGSLETGCQVRCSTLRRADKIISSLFFCVCSENKNLNHNLEQTERRM